MTLSRKHFGAGSAAVLASIAFIKGPAQAAEFEYKYGHDLNTDHPLHVRSVQLWKAVREETGGRLNVTLFPNNQLGNDTAMVSQLRSGALQFLAIQGVNVSGVVPLAGMDGLGFVFKTAADATRTFDGELGAFVRKDFAAKGIYAFDRVFDLGFRQITSGNRAIKSAADLANFKIRTPPAKIAVDLFKTLGASPTPINFGELYTALQTHVVDGQETPFLVIQTQRFFEVQKFLAVSNHSWTGFWLLGNNESYQALPSDIKAIVERNVRKYVALERHDVGFVNDATADKLRRLGMTFTHVDQASMRAPLAPYYANWRSEFGPMAWDLLEKSVGKLR